MKKSNWKRHSASRPTPIFWDGWKTAGGVPGSARAGTSHTAIGIEFPRQYFRDEALGVERVLSLSAVGSLQEEHKPFDFVIPDQFFDRTHHRTSTFFGEGLVAHISFADPICGELSEVVHRSAQQIGISSKAGGTYLCMEGPAFSTRAESNVYRSWGMDVIGMTNLQEAKLAREAEICYVTIAMVTDYDCWHEEHDAVSVDQIIENLTKNAANACKLVRHVVGELPAARGCKCGVGLEARDPDRP